ncbi:metallophosphoesterase [Anaerofustis sp. NSJ-163]|uniref:metallophosphoesterase n=1 Tax=Anaerofustis sp. NSJ-163 TaxID=2944391 RepID=UPI00209BF9E4|nr:metallophosphoesterase [Anaerofustis sp. NSJ-163]MCO8193226.1 metallophosphoesterase [Anaerofustis sp. NSJ-163]
MRKFKIVTLLIVLILFVYLYFENTSLFIVQKNEIVSNKIDSNFDGYKILQLSDLHSREFGENNIKLINKIYKIDPDIIVCTGDMMNSTEDDGHVFINLVKKISKDYPVYYIDGNHEQLVEYNNVGVYNEFISSLKDLDVKVVKNTKIKLQKGSSYINMYGLNVDLVYYSTKSALKESNIEYTEDNFSKTINKETFENNKYNILLTHNPIYFEVYEKSGVDLILAGHVHGGIIRIPFKGGLLSPDQEWFPKYYHGLYTINDTNMIVSAGLGNDTVNFRIFNPFEMNLITLRSE